MAIPLKVLKQCVNSDSHTHFYPAGPLSFSVQLLLISVFSTLIVVPWNAVIVVLFRKSKKKYLVDVDKLRQENMQLSVGTSDKVNIESA